MATKIKVIMPNNPVPQDGTVLGIKPIQSAPLEYELEDGHKIKIEVQLLQVVSVDGQKQQDGKPVYQFSIGQKVDVL
jgi:hypothetical protein